MGLDSELREAAMIIDSRLRAPESHIEADVCVVGAGPAGIALARELARASIEVCVLEAGLREPAPEFADLFSGESRGVHYTQLERTRSQAFGGTSWRWDFEFGSIGPQVQMRPFDAHDFEHRPWIPHSGWPFGRDDLVPYYRRAQGMMGLGDSELDFDLWDDAETSLDWASFDPVRFRYGPSRLFTDTYMAEFEETENICVYLGAVATEILVEPNGVSVESIRARSLNGHPFSVFTRCFVLACGGIENPRLLLASDTAQSSGLGNEHGLVGRFFMEHPHVRSGLLVAQPKVAGLIPDGVPEKLRGSLSSIRLAPRVQLLEERELPSFGLHLIPLSSTARSRFLALQPDLTEGGEAATRMAKSLSRGRLPERAASDVVAVAKDPRGAGKVALGALRWGLGESRVGIRNLLGAGEEPPPIFGLDAMVEQIPNRESKVLLDGSVNRLGMRRPVLHWDLTEVDRRCFREIYEIFDQEAKRLRLGSTHARGNRHRFPELGLAPFRRDIAAGHHHMGTTRMHPDPKQGVVDADCRVHSLDNLYIAGSSVFPTSGYANPTLTVVALALKLAAHLLTRLESID